MPDDSLWDERVKSAFVNQVGGIDGSWTFERLEMKPNHVRGGRLLMRATAPDGSDRAVIKAYGKPGMAKMRFATAESLSQRTKTVVRPRFVIPHKNLYVMDDVGNRTLLDILDAGERVETVERGSQWLAGYATDVGAGRHPFNPGGILNKSRQYLDQVSGGMRSRRDRMLSTLEATFAPFRDREMDHIQVFGDTTPGNLCISGNDGQLIAIDYVASGIGPVERDLAFFLQWCRAQSWRQDLRAGGTKRFFWQRPAINRRSVMQQRAAALDVFGGSLDSALLDAYLYGFLLHMWMRVNRAGLEPDLLAEVERQCALS